MQKKKWELMITQEMYILLIKFKVDIFNMSSPFQRSLTRELNLENQQTPYLSKTWSFIKYWKF